MGITISPVMMVFLVFMTGFAGFVDSAAGGGGLISLPAYLFAGLPPHYTYATNKFSAACGTTFATASFFKNGAMNVKVGILAAITAESPAYQYSGYLMGYVHLANALYRAAPETWQTLRDSLPDTVRADLRQNSAYWAQFDGLVNTAATKVYDGFLKSNGLTDGVQNYGTVVDLLLAYFDGK